ncbi:hypothetical protein Tco_0452268, partial [Tanacetum coccineum]
GQIRGFPSDLSLVIAFSGDMSPGISETEKLEWDTFPSDIPGRQRRAHIVSVKQLSATVEAFPIQVRLLVGSPGASTTPIHSPGSSSTPIYSPGASTTPIYSPGSSSTLIYSPGALRNAECSNCKHLLDKITVLEAMLEMYKNPEQHTLNSAALLHEVYNDMGKLDLE